MASRHYLMGCLGAVLATGVPPSLAQTYPHKPIRWVVPYAPGGAADPIARLIGQKLAEAWGQPVVIDNRPGAGGNIGTDVVAKAAPDGHTIVLVAASTVTINQSLYAKLPYDPVRDLAPVAIVATDVLVLVQTQSLPTSSVAEVIALARAKPGQVQYASGGTGSGGHLAMELFKAMAGIDLVHVPYKGAGSALPNLIAGQVSLMTTSAATAMPHVRSGRLKALGVTGADRAPTLPDLPTVSEAGLKGYEVTGWYGVLVPARTPAAVVAKMNAEIVRIVSSAEVSERLTGMGLIPRTTTPQEMGAVIARDAAKWAKVVKQAGIRAD
jgi:tripartite-type tricarboxylate transporter receptor subunit TctC